MLIDWFTVVAQIVNFLVLVWLLKRFLYKPILQMIDDRQKEINEQLNEAKIKKSEAEEECETFRKKNLEIDQQKDELVKKIKEETAQLRNQSISEIKNEVEKQKIKWFSSLHSEKNEIFRELSEKLQKGVFSIARKALADLSATNVEACIVETFLQRLNKISKEEKEEFIASLSPSRSVQIVSASEISQDFHEKINTAIQQVFNQNINVSFVISPDLIAGIELLSNGKKISWNVANYLTELEAQIDEALVKYPEHGHD